MERKWWVLVSVGIGTFMSALDGSIVNVLLPVIRRDFGCEVAAVQWAVTVYLLAVSVLLLMFGRLGDLRGHKLVYVSGFGLFVLGSALCGASPGLDALVFFRGVQAVGAAMLFASRAALLTMNFPANQRGQALGLQATMTYLGLAFGPALGGWLAQHVRLAGGVLRERSGGGVGPGLRRVFHPLAAPGGDRRTVRLRRRDLLHRGIGRPAVGD